MILHSDAQLVPGQHLAARHLVPHRARFAIVTSELLPALPVARVVARRAADDGHAVDGVAKVLGVDVEGQRISLGMRQLESNPWDLVEENYPIGSIVSGKVRNITDFGIFVGVEEGIDGLVHISDLSWSQRIRHPSEVYKKGDEVEARVLNIDRDGERFSLGIKQLSDDPWLSVHSRYFLGQLVKGRIVSHTDFGIFVEIEDGVEGLVHMSELLHEEEWEAHYKLGVEISVEIRRIDPHDRKISLSEKDAVERGDNQTSVEEYMARQGESSARLGDVLGDLSKKLGS